MNRKNIGDLLNAKNITWGWFASGFKTIDKTPDGRASCDGPHRQQHTNVGGITTIFTSVCQGLAKTQGAASSRKGSNRGQ
ncbi:MAG: hypothetical protein WA667_10315 [Candidatus Nitrosopolaris sp.]